MIRQALEFLVQFTYDDRGHRVNKKLFSTQPGQGESNTYYVRDASGQPMAVYVMNDGSANEILTPTIEYPIYGLSRLGVGNNDDVYKYQLTDHLGNVRGVIQRDYASQVILNEDFEQGVVNSPPWHGFQNTSVSVLNGQLRADVSNIPDKNHIKLSFTAVAHKTYNISFDANLTNTPYTLHYGIDGNDLGSQATNGTVSFQYTSLQGGTTDIYFSLDTDPTVPTFGNYYTLDNVTVTDVSTNNTPIMLAYKDYYPFGMPMPNRNVEGEYRYAFQGQEKDPETGMEAFELRLWDARLGRWLTTDPAGQYASPYLGMGNNPISLSDPDGGMAKRGGGCPPDCSGLGVWFLAKAKSYFGFTTTSDVDNVTSNFGIDTGMAISKENEKGLDRLQTAAQGIDKGLNKIDFIGMYNASRFFSAIDSDQSFSQYYSGMNDYLGTDYDPWSDGIATGSLFLSAATLGGASASSSLNLNASYFWSNGRVFYSGAGSSKLASDFARKNGFDLVTDKWYGKTANFLSNVTRGRFDQKIWGAASWIYARTSTGTVHVFLNSPLRPHNIWTTIENPTLQKIGTTIIRY